MANAKRQDGRIQRSVTLGHDPLTGKTIRKYVYGKTQSEVNMKVKELKESIIKNEILDKSTLLSEYADIWLETAVSKERYNSYRSYKGIIKNHIKPTIGLLPISLIKPIQVQNVITKLESKGKSRTADLFRLTVSQIFESAIDNDLCERNPAKRTKKPKYNAKPVAPLTEKEIDCLISAQIEPVARLYMLLCLFAGLRKGEALATKINEQKEIKVQEVVVDKKIKQAPKTIAGIRSIKTLPIVEEAFSKIDSNQIYIFSEFTGSKPYQRMWNKIEKGFQDSMKPIKARKITAHVLRHTFCTLLYYAEFDVLQAQYLMGHDSLEVTLKTYTHIQKTSLGKKDKYQKWKPILRKFFLNEWCQNDVKANH